MNRKNSPGNKKLLLDTSFLLPTLGFETSDRIMKAIPKLVNYELYYSGLSILEALWKITKKIKGTDDEIQRIADGVEAINETMKPIIIDNEAVKNSIKMYLLGHRDMIDNLLYSIALSNKIKLLTIDTKLIEFVTKHKLPSHYIIEPENL